MKIAFYTCNINNYDTPKVHYGLEGIDFYYISNDKENQYYERQFYTDIVEEDKVRTARFFKILPHKFNFLKSYDISVWIDSSIVVKKNPIEFIEKHIKNNTIALSKHRDGADVRHEFEICKRLHFKEKERIDKQEKKYEHDNFNLSIPKVETGILIRRHNDEQIKKAMELWWKQIYEFSKRDQLSFNYAMWKTNTNYNMFEEIRSKEWNNFFTLEPHRGFHRA
jgi:adenylate cyclase class IV